MTPQKNAAGLYEATIDGARYEFGKWPAEDSLETLVDLSAILGGSVAPLLAGVQEGASWGDLPVEKLMGALSSQLRLNREAALRIVRRLGEYNVMCNGTAVNFSAHYQMRMVHCFKVVRAALEVQFGDFFGALGDIAGLQVAPTPQASSTSTGGSGGP